MSKINVLVTGVGGFGHGSSIVKALLKSSLALNIIGTDASPRLIHASAATAKEIVPGAFSEGYIDAIVKLIKKYSIDCLFTGSEQELLKISLHRKDIEAFDVKVFMNNNNTIMACKNKIKCNELLFSLGFEVPKTILIKQIEDVKKLNFFPAVVKPNLDTGASKNVFVVKNKDEMRLLAGFLLNSGIDVIAQEYIPYSNNEYTVGVTSLLEEPRVVSSIAMRRFIEGPSSRIVCGDITISSGLSQGEFLDFPQIRCTCEAIAEKIKSTGPLNVQLRLINNKVKPFEINPRFSGTTSARSLNGYNEPEFYLRKYLLNDKNAIDSLVNTNRGFVVKAFDEIYVRYD